MEFAASSVEPKPPIESEEDQLRYNGLAVFNSVVYLIGGCKRIGPRELKDVKGYRYLDMTSAPGRKGWRWRRRRSATTASGDQSGGTTIFHDGWVCSVGGEGKVHLFQFHIPSSESQSPSWQLPAYPEYKRRTTYLLGSTTCKLYIYTSETGEDDSNTMLSYDFGSREWIKVLDSNFWGYWSQGVVLYFGAPNDPDNAYLFSFGFHHPTDKDGYHMGWYVPGVYAFHLRTQKWLPEPVVGLEAFLPGEDLLSEDLGITRCVLQIGGGGCVGGNNNNNQEDLHKLALIWSCGYFNSNDDKSGEEIHWAKFVLYPLSHRPTSSQQHPDFHAKVVSDGVCLVEEDTFHGLNCTAGIDASWTRDRKGKKMSVDGTSKLVKRKQKEDVGLFEEDEGKKEYKKQVGASQRRTPSWMRL